MLLPSRRASIGSTYNSGEASSEVDERQKYGNVGFTTVHAQERSKCNAIKNLSA